MVPVRQLIRLAHPKLVESSDAAGPKTGGSSDDIDDDGGARLRGSIKL